MSWSDLSLKFSMILTEKAQFVVTCQVRQCSGCARWRLPVWLAKLGGFQSLIAPREVPSCIGLESAPQRWKILRISNPADPSARDRGRRDCISCGEDKQRYLEARREEVDGVPLHMLLFLAVVGHVDSQELCPHRTAPLSWRPRLSHHQLPAPATCCSQRRSRERAAADLARTESSTSNVM